MSPHGSDPSPQRTSPARRSRRARLGVLAVAGLVAMTATGCNVDEAKRLGVPVPATKEAPIILHLWQGSWIAALAVGALVWGLILWCVVFYRRKRTGIEIPAQTRYNVPIEVLFTVVPFIIIAVLFFFTAKDESKLLQLHKDPAVKVNVVGRQWSWSWNYNYDAVTKQETPGQPAVYDAGTPAELPVLWLPVNERVRFSLTSTDVIHSFWVPNFLFKLDVVPGRVNQFELTPTKEGDFIGRCAELCGVDHSRMLFKVHVTDAASYQQHLKDLADKIDPVTGKGQTGQLPVGYNPNDVPLRVGPLTGIGNDSTGKEK
ncbi:MAG: cytochrome c oxidase subunit II [Catenulispora sp.]